MKLLISHKSKKEFKDFLEENKIEYLLTIDNPNLDKRIADHPDLSVFVIDSKNIIVDENVYDYYKKNLEDINVIKGQKVNKNYPKDSIYNVVKFKNFYIHNDFTEKNIEKFLKDYKFLKVNQGYTRCSSIVLNDSIITSDYGIYKKLKKKINIILIEEEKIDLDGFDKGFIGGTCGKLSDKLLIFNGDIKSLSCYGIIYKQSKKENIDIIYPKCKLLDTGSLIRIG